MGLEDLVRAEETVTIKVSEYKALIRDAHTTTVIRLALERGVPCSYIQLVLTGEMEPDPAGEINAALLELEAYRATGITPDRFEVIDEEYRKLSRDKSDLLKKNEELQATCRTLKSYLDAKSADLRDKEKELGLSQQQGAVWKAQLDAEKGIAENRIKEIDILRQTVEGYKKKVETLKATNEDLYVELAKAKQGITIRVPAAGSAKVQI